eukprot:GHVN01059641.1.p1 GENE.GHVN01059641.1~~GHVN01059641.1.p1  ORF type:complete len:172 (+),score=14.70 GHVN01059641.1:33-518(+)
MTHEESPQFMNKWKKNPEPQLIPPEQYEDSSKSFHIVPRIRPWQKVKMVKDEKTGKEAEVRVPVPFFDNPSLRRFLGFIIVAYIGFGYYLGPVAWLYYLIRMIYTRWDDWVRKCSSSMNHLLRNCLLAFDWNCFHSYRQKRLAKNRLVSVPNRAGRQEGWL